MQITTSPLAPPVVPLAPFDRHTLNQIFFEAIDRFGPLEALRTKRDGRWQSLTYREAELQVDQVAALFEEWQLRPGDRVAILSENRPEWAIVDYAALALGLIVVPIYPTLPTDQVEFILRDSGARVAFASTSAQLEKLLVIRTRVASLERTLVFDKAAALEGIPSLDALLERVDESISSYGRQLRKRAYGVAAESLATIIYTSGTTGIPKGVMLTHANIASMLAATRQHGSLRTRPGMVGLSLLPLSHVLERAAAYYYWDSGVTIAYAESVAAVPANLLEVRPNCMVAVPRLFDKVYGKVMGSEGVKGRLVAWAARIGGRIVDHQAAGTRPPLGLRLQHRIADALVFRKIRHGLGGRLETMICGGAPLSPVVARFFLGAGIPLYEGYGLTESSPVLAANRPEDWRLGTVGLPYPGVELQIGPEGEILARGPQVMQGYWNNPEATRAAIDADGWLHTGDVGAFDEDGFLAITDRIKELIVTAGGKKVAPQPIEGMTRLSPFVAQSVLVGDRRPFPALLVVPEFERLMHWAKERGLEITDRARLIREAPVIALLEAETLGRLAHLAQFERPKKLAILSEDLTVDGGLLTPTFKVKRRLVEKHFQATIEALYAEVAAKN
ncbi:MAG: long-chain fatty acid--CoA ligase [Gemmatimonadetes bacterium]|nr:long-chain fatty acid--CoA ligase [Gemmatimonadota bacterium]